MRSIEEKVEEHYKKMLETYQIRHYGKTEEINPTITKALKDANSKSGGNGNNFPDIQVLFENQHARRIPVMIEAKGEKNKLEKLTKDGMIEGITYYQADVKNKQGVIIHKLGDANYSSIVNYAVNGAVHYANAILDSKGYDEVIAIGINGTELNADGSVKDAQCKAYYISTKNNRLPKHIIELDNDLSLLKYSNSEKFCIQAINKYLEFLKKDKLRLSAVKIQQKNFLENVISDADYKFLKNRLKKDGNMEWYFVVRYLAATGARVSELIQIKVEHVFKGYFDLYSKGGKLRRLYIPKTLKTETESWLKDKGITSGYLFLNRFGERITVRGISQQLKNYANKYGLNPKVVYPHSFRHRFAKNFLEKFNDISLLADLMGHESIETTRIYLRKTASEQQEIVDKIVTW